MWMLSPHLLDLLRAWWKAARPQRRLFPSREPAAADDSTRQRHRARLTPPPPMADIHKRVSRTPCAQLCHQMLEQNIDVSVILGAARSRQERNPRRLDPRCHQEISEVMSPLETISTKFKEITAAR